MGTLILPFTVLGRLRYDNSSLGCGEKNNTDRQTDKITDAHKRHRMILDATCHSWIEKCNSRHETCFFALHFSSSKRILIQLHLIAPLSLLSLCQRFDLYFVKIVVRPETILKHGRCCAFPRNLDLVFVCLWEGDNQKGRLKKQAYLISWASDTAEWDRKVSAVQELLLQIVALFSARVYLLDGGWGLGEAEKWQGKRLSFWEEFSWIGKLL